MDTVNLVQWGACSLHQKASWVLGQAEGSVPCDLAPQALSTVSISSQDTSALSSAPHRLSHLTPPPTPKALACVPSSPHCQSLPAAQPPRSSCRQFWLLPLQLSAQAFKLPLLPLSHSTSIDMGRHYLHISYVFVETTSEDGTQGYGLCPWWVSELPIAKIST